MTAAGDADHIIGVVEVALTKDLSKFEVHHLESIRVSAKAIINSQDFLFNCITCDFKTNKLLSGLG